MLNGNAIIGQSGGPTSVINASLAGVIEACMEAPQIDKVYGMHFGIEGFMQKDLLDLGNQSRTIIEGLKKTPSSALGSSRHKVINEDFPKILEVLKAFNIRYLFMIGGNDTMDTIHRVETYCQTTGYEMIGIGIPKTVDNDLFGTDHTPGFASAARSNILNVLQGGILARDMQKVDQFVIYQTIGRDAGWLAAATAMARKDEEDAPHLIYTPEFDFEQDKFLSDFEKIYNLYGFVSIVCGEGIKYADGTPVSASRTKDKFSNVEFGAMGGTSVALMLHRMISEKFGFRGEFQITESLIMSAADRAAETDRTEAYRCGAEAVKLALSGTTGKMIGIHRESNTPYTVSYKPVPLADVAVKARPMPKNYFTSNGTFVSEAFLDYLRPLVGTFPDYIKLKKQAVNH
ncbi:MAG: diphosphate--fructose-6-phosphate 1-phosphotransferase [Chlorobi bacterium]|nr:diphosphate--fructose-6-phosphate 1-phosphotransferase [Chlorobiota bacterium]